MIQKYVIVLFATVLYNSVTYSSPTSTQLSDASLPEEKPPSVSAVTVSQISKKIESTSSHKVLKDSLPVPQNVTVTLQDNENSASMPNDLVKITTNSTILNTTDVKINDKISETKHQDPVNKNISKVIENKNMSKVINNENASHPIEINNATIPKTVPINKNTSALSPIPAVAEDTTKASITPTQTTVKPTSKPDVSTLAPPSSSEKNVLEHNKPAPSEEKHFDGPSFIGGIVLTIGLTAIGFIAFKYYKSGKIDRNYRTL